MLRIYEKIESLHTFATRAHRYGVDDKTLQSMGGWKDLATMKNIYIHTTPQTISHLSTLHCNILL